MAGSVASRSFAAESPTIGYSVRYVDHVLAPSESLTQALTAEGFALPFRMYGRHGWLGREKELNPQVKQWQNVGPGTHLKLAIPYFKPKGDDNASIATPSDSNADLPAPSKAPATNNTAVSPPPPAPSAPASSPSPPVFVTLPPAVVHATAGDTVELNAAVSGSDLQVTWMIGEKAVGAGTQCVLTPAALGGPGTYIVNLDASNPLGAAVYATAIVVAPRTDGSLPTRLAPRPEAPPPPSPPEPAAGWSVSAISGTGFIYSRQRLDLVDETPKPFAVPRNLRTPKDGSLRFGRVGIDRHFLAPGGRVYVYADEPGTVHLRLKKGRLLSYNLLTARADWQIDAGKSLALSPGPLATFIVSRNESDASTTVSVMQGGADAKYAETDPAGLMTQHALHLPGGTRVRFVDDKAPEFLAQPGPMMSQASLAVGPATAPSLEERRSSTIVTLKTGYFSFRQSGAVAASGASPIQAAFDVSLRSSDHLAGYASYRLVYDQSQKRNRYEAGIVGARYFILGARETGASPYGELGLSAGNFLIKTTREVENFSSDFVGANAGIGLFWRLGPKWGLDVDLGAERADGYNELQFGATSEYATLGWSYVP